MHNGKDMPLTPPSAAEPRPRTVPTQDHEDTGTRTWVAARVVNHSFTANLVPSPGHGGHMAAHGHDGIRAAPTVPNWKHAQQCGWRQWGVGQGSAPGVPVRQSSSEYNRAMWFPYTQIPGSVSSMTKGLSVTEEEQGWDGER